WPLTEAFWHEVVQGEMAEIRPGLVQGPRYGWPPHQALEVGGEVRLPRGERLDDPRIEQRGCRSAVSQGEVAADRPGAPRELALGYRVGGLQQGPSPPHPVWILAALRAQQVAHDLLHRHVHVQVEEAIPEPRLQGGFGLVRHERPRAG